MGGSLLHLQYFVVADQLGENVDNLCAAAQRFSTGTGDNSQARPPYIKVLLADKTHIYGRVLLLGRFLHISTAPTITTNPLTFNNNENEMD
jgi:hypothetical protein